MASMDQKPSFNQKEFEILYYALQQDIAKMESLISEQVVKDQEEIALKNHVVVMKKEVILAKIGIIIGNDKAIEILEMKQKALQREKIVPF